MSEALAYGARLALAYNPVLAVLGAALAAALLAPRKVSLDRRVWGISALAIAWLIGDGMRIIARARDVFDSYAPLISPNETTAAAYTALAIWAVLGILIGYVFPTWAGAFVGRRVTHGTGWLAAASVAVGVSLAVSTVVSFVTV